MVTIRSPFCGNNLAQCVELLDEDLPVIQRKVNQLVEENVHLPTKHI